MNKIASVSNSVEHQYLMNSIKVILCIVIVQKYLSHHNAPIYITLFLFSVKMSVRVILTLLHPERPKLHGVLAALSAIGLRTAIGVKFISNIVKFEFI